MDAEVFWHASAKGLHDLGFFEKETLISLNGACTCAKWNDAVIAKSIGILLEQIKEAGSDRTLHKTSSWKCKQNCNE